MHSRPRLADEDLPADVRVDHLELFDSVNMKLIGLIGGMSWESTAYYYKVMNQEAARKYGGLHSAPILLHSVDFSPIARMQKAGQWDQAGRELSRVARRLQDAGAEVLGLATNTMHYVAQAIEDATKGLPFVHIARPTGEAIRNKGCGTVGLIGTRFTMEMGFYREKLLSMGISVVVPEDGIPEIHRIIYDELCLGIVLPSSRAFYVEEINKLKARGAEAVILGCTEITMLIDETDSPLPCFDTTPLHAKALVGAACE